MFRLHAPATRGYNRALMLREDRSTGVQPRWSTCIAGRPEPAEPPDGKYLLGVLSGEGIGPEVVSAALLVLQALESESRLRFAIETGPAVGDADKHQGQALRADAIEFCEGLFARGGAVLCGPAGGRFVYDLRRRFDLFCKLSPLIPRRQLWPANRLKPEYLHGVDCMVVRDNAAGIYQGTWHAETCPERGRVAHHSFSYAESEVLRIVDVAARIAERRQRRLTVVVKDGGIPTVSDLWRECATAIARQREIELSFLNVDYAVYRMLQSPSELDVLVAPNMFGDLLIDLGGILTGSRGLTFSGNFATTSAAVYQTNHGAAHDLTASDRANPLGQIDSLALLLRESFALTRAAATIERAVCAVLEAGWRTADIAEPGCRLVGTRALAERVAEAVITLARERELE